MKKQIIYMLTLLIFFSITNPLTASFTKQQALETLRNHKKTIFSIFFTACLPLFIYHFPVDIKKSPQQDFSIFEDGHIIDQIKNKKPIAYWFHGWGDFRPQNNLGKRFNEKGIFVLPHFSDLRTNKRWYCYFGTDKDVTLALKSMKETYDGSRSSINLLGRSRGGQTTLNALNALVASNLNLFNLENASEAEKGVITSLVQENNKLLNEAEINEETRQGILRQIEQGKIGLFVPLLSPQQTIYNQFGTRCGDIFHKKILPFLSRGCYQPNLLGACEKLELIAKYIKKDGKPCFDIRVYFADSDWMTKTTYSQKWDFVANLNAFNGKKVERINLAGGHISVGKQSLSLFLEQIA